MNGSGIDIRAIKEAIRSATQEGGPSWQPVENFMTRLSAEERKLRLGAEPPAEELSLAEREEVAKANLEIAVTAGAGYPAVYDLTNVGGQDFVGGAQNQGGCGSCVAFGACASVEGSARKQRGNASLKLDLSEAHLFFCLARAQGRTCANGWWPDKAMDCFKDPGVADENCYPYVAQDQNCTNLCGDWKNRVTKVTGWHRVSDPAAMKTWISTSGPLAGCFTVYEDFFAYKTGVYKHATGGVAGGHCISIVGYDDNQKFWKCKNSWGTAWGENGFFRIAYGQCGIDSAAWAVEGVILPATWLNNCQIRGLWTTDQDLNGWVYIEKAGWKKISAENANIFFDMLGVLSMAKASQRPVNLLENNNVIKQVYVL